MFLFPCVRRLVIPSSKGFTSVSLSNRVLSPIINPAFLSCHKKFTSLQNYHTYHTYKRPTFISTQERNTFLYKPTIQVRNAQFWKVVTNLRLLKGVFKDQYQGRGGHNFRVRVVWVALAFIVLNMIFNIMMVVLTNLYFNEIQQVPWSFGFWASTEYKKAIANEEIIKNTKLASKHYLKTLKMVYENKTKKSADDDSLDFVLPNELLQDLANSKEFDFLSSYFDLMMRYGLSSADSGTSCLFITKALNLIDEFQLNYNIEFGSYTLKCSSLRFLAEYLRDRGHNDPKTFGKIENYYLKIIQLVKTHENPIKGSKNLLILNEDNNNKDSSDELNYKLAIIPQNIVASQLMIESVMDLCVFYISTDNLSYINKSLSLLLSLMRSADYELDILANLNNKNYTQEVKLVKDKTPERFDALQYEIIPLIQSHTSEVLWYLGDQSRAIELAKEATYKATLKCKDSASCAKIAKIGFKNLALMYSQIGDEVGAEVCKEKYNEIEIPIEGFLGDALVHKEKDPVRKAVLYRYFGEYGTLIFP